MARPPLETEEETVGKGKRRGGRALDLALPTAAVCLAALAAFMAFPLMRTQSAYDALTDPSEGGGGIDWTKLLSRNPETVAWIEVEGTEIDYPVVKPGPDKPRDWYLTHDFWGNESDLGCPYIDPRCDADGDHALVYGHHMGLSDQMFSSIYESYLRPSFDRVGCARWSTPDRGTVVFRRALALRVDRGYAAIQRFEFDSDEDLREWLFGLQSDAVASCAGTSYAAASSPSLEELAASATRVLTLVTCSSDRSGERDRTLLVFLA